MQGAKDSGYPVTVKCRGQPESLRLQLKPEGQPRKKRDSLCLRRKAASTTSSPDCLLRGPQEKEVAGKLQTK